MAVLPGQLGLSVSRDAPGTMICNCWPCSSTCPAPRKGSVPVLVGTILVTLSWGTENQKWKHVAGHPVSVGRGALRRRRYIPEPRASEAALRRSAALGNGPFRIDYAEGVTQSFLRHASFCGTPSAYGFAGAGDPGCAASRGCAALPATLGFGV